MPCSPRPAACSVPAAGWSCWRSPHRAYFHRLVPFIGGLLAERAAYAYLPASESYLPDEGTLRMLIESAGFVDVERLLLGAGSVQLVTARAEPMAEAA